MKINPKREKFTLRRFRVTSDKVAEQAIALIRNLPIDTGMPLEIVVREEVKARKPDQNALMWSGPLVDVAAQVWVDGRSYSEEIWHEQFKQSYLPEEFDPELCMEGYTKYDFMPNGDRVMIGSTKKLTVKGFAQYLEQVYAFGAEWGVKFHTPGEVTR